MNPPRSSKWTLSSLGGAIPKIDTTNRIKPISRCHPECRFMAFSALMRYGIKHRKTTTAGSEIISILLTYCIKPVMSRVAHNPMVGDALLRTSKRRKVKDFFIKFKKKSHFADFFTKQTLDFVLHCLLCGLAEMHTDDIGCLADLLSDSRSSGGVGCGIVHSKSSCK